MGASGRLPAADGARCTTNGGACTAIRCGWVTAAARTLLREPFFVLRYTTDPHARAAFAAYANSCRTDYPALAADIDAALARWTE